MLFAKIKFYDWFGGATVSPASGIWRLPDGTIADENVDILTSLSNDDDYDDPSFYDAYVLLDLSNDVPFLLLHAYELYFYVHVPFLHDEQLFYDDELL